MASNQLKMLNNPFAPIAVEDLAPQLPPIKYEETREVWNLIPKASKVIDADGVSTDVIEYEPVKVQEISIKEYIESFSDDVGIQNILRKVAMTGDKSYLNQTGRVPLCKDGGLEPVQDYTDVPSNKTAAFNAVVSGVAAYDSLPEEIKGKMSFEQFAQEFGQSQYDAFVKSLIDKYSQKEDKGGQQ